MTAAGAITILCGIVLIVLAARLKPAQTRSQNVTPNPPEDHAQQNHPDDGAPPGRARRAARPLLLTLGALLIVTGSLPLLVRTPLGSAWHERKPVTLVIVGAVEEADKQTAGPNTAEYLRRFNEGTVSTDNAILAYRLATEALEERLEQSQADTDADAAALLARAKSAGHLADLTTQGLAMKVLTPNEIQRVFRAAVYLNAKVDHTAPAKAVVTLTAAPVPFQWWQNFSSEPWPAVPDDAFQSGLFIGLGEARINGTRANIQPASGLQQIDDDWWQTQPNAEGIWQATFTITLPDDPGTNAASQTPPDAGSQAQPDPEVLLLTRLGVRTNSDLLRPHVTSRLEGNRAYIWTVRFDR